MVRKMSMLKKLAKVVSGALAIGAMFYLAGGAVAGAGSGGLIPGIDAVTMGVFGFSRGSHTGSHRLLSEVNLHSFFFWSPKRL